MFNDPAGVVPKRDFNVTITPLTDVWLRIGPTWVSATIKEEIVFYRKYASERAANNSYRLGWRIPINRLTFNANFTYLTTRERPGYEIDTRAQRSERGFGGTLEIRALAKTYFGVRADQRTVNFREGVQYLGISLHDELNRRTTTGGMNIRHELTPLTTVTIEVARQQDRFVSSTLRDSNSTLFSGGLRFDQFALLKGTATFGVRVFEPLSPDVPKFTGSTFGVDLAYTLLGATRFGVQGTRDVQYSYDVNQPYYVQTGISGSIAQQIFGPVDVVVRAGVQRLEYRDRVGAIIPVPDRVDYVRSYGGGLGYHLGNDLRIGINVDQQRRRSELEIRQYNDLKYGTSITYGF